MYWAKIVLPIELLANGAAAYDDTSPDCRDPSSLLYFSAFPLLCCEHVYVLAESSTALMMPYRYGSAVVISSKTLTGNYYCSYVHFRSTVTTE